MKTYFELERWGDDAYYAARRLGGDGTSVAVAGWLTRGLSRAYGAPSPALNAVTNCPTGETTQEQMALGHAAYMQSMNSTWAAYTRSASASHGAESPNTISSRNLTGAAS